METAKSKERNPPRAVDFEQLIEGYYEKLQKWGVVLCRGDRATAQEIVHDLCLHFILARPDLSQVANLDGYLYTCLRHIYSSALARSSREALQTFSIADFDSVQFALHARITDSLLDQQNDLRRICNYAVWRKESSKSASYFLLLFFHGYTRREVGEIARLPLAAIYNKLKVAREELKAHLVESGKLRTARRDVPPIPDLRAGTVSSVELFQELRENIFRERSSDCLQEETLLAHYRTSIPKPIPCSLLSHIVSCEQCLSLLDRHFQRPVWQDREPPGSSWSTKDGDGVGAASHPHSGYHAMKSLVRRQKDGIYEHRPRTLSIAINGRIVALHDVQSERSTLASRVEHPETVQFVEVFADQLIRIALLPIEALPPGGSHVHTQTVALSDGRQLELTVSFDGQGLHSEVTYLDPALAAEALEETPDDTSLAVESVPVLASLPALLGKGQTIREWIAHAIDAISPRFAPAWAAMLASVLGGAGYLAYRYTHAPLDARTILNNSVKLEAANEKGQVEHAIMRFDAVDIDGRTVWQGTVDTWHEQSTGRTMLRLYNTQHRLIAAEWRRQNGENGSFEEPAGGPVSPTDQKVAESELWKYDVSVRAFQTMASQHVDIRKVRSDYELTGSGLSSGPFRVVSATVVLNRSLHIVGETLHMRNGYEFSEVRFVEASYNYLPTASVPESIFDPSDLNSGMHSNLGASSSKNGIGTHLAEMDPRLVQTEVATLYRLSELGADVGVPIEITRTPSGHIRIAGMVGSEGLKSRIIAELENVPNRQLLEIDLKTEKNFRIPIPAPRLVAPPTDVYNMTHEVSPADPVLRRYFAAKRIPGGQIDSTVSQFSRDALDHAQRALQNAYALDRLGSSFSANELKIMGPAAQQQWAAMVARHSSALETELDELRQQLSPLSSAGNAGYSRRQFSTIDNPADFASSARKLLLETQDLNRAAGSAFSSGLTGAAAGKSADFIGAAMESIPLGDAEQVVEFASRLTNAKKPGNSSAGRYPRQ